MSERIITLFGEEFVPEQVKAVGKSRAKKKPEEKQKEIQTELLPAAEEPLNDSIAKDNTTPS